MHESPSANAKTEGAPEFAQSKAELGFNLDNISIKPLADAHQRAAFVCTNQKIQNYFRNNARKNNDAYMIRCFVACQGDSMDALGYYYLALTSYKIAEKGEIDESAQHLDEASDGKFGRVDAVPAVYLGMIGVHAEFVRKGIGQMMMLDAIQRTAKIAQHAGLYALTLDAVDEEVANYYRDKFGFQTFKAGKTGLEMFLPIKTILAGLPHA